MVTSLSKNDKYMGTTLADSEGSPDITAKPFQEHLIHKVSCLEHLHMSHFISTICVSHMLYIGGIMLLSPYHTSFLLIRYPVSVPFSP